MPRRLLLALLIPFAALALQWLLWEHIRPYVWFLFFPAAYFSAWVGGLRGGLAAALISVLLVWFVFMPPAFSFHLERPSDSLSLVLFVGMASLFALFFERLHQARLRSESHFEATFEQAAVGMGLAAPDGRWLRVNRRLTEIVGYSAEELLSLSFQGITHPEDLEADLELVRQVLDGTRATYTLEKRYLRKDGRAVWVSLFVALARTPDGRPDYFISVIEDIQARKEAEAHLQEVRGLAQLGHWHWDLATGAHVWSKEIHQLYGRDPHLPPAAYPEVRSYFTPESWAVLAARVEQALADGQPYVCDVEVVRPDGGHRWVTVRGQGLGDRAGRPVALYGTVQDITDRKLAELALATSERRFRELVESANSAIIQWAPDGTILFFNPFAQSFFGFSREEAMGRSVTMLVPERESTGADLSGLVAGIAAHPERFKGVVNENIRKDGSRVWVHWTNRALRDSSGRVTSILAIGNDHTERRRAEEELKARNEELEQFNRAAVGRELEMIRLKRQVNALLAELGREREYDLSFAEEQPGGGGRA